MFLAAGGFPSLSLVLLTLVGGSLAAGGANALNCYLDRDIDALMHRTGARPSATGEISPRANLNFGLGLSALAFGFLYLLVNPLSAWLGLFAIAFYVVGYTMLLKRRTPQNIVWGGIAGCMPVLIGWAAVRNDITWAPIVLFLVIFWWTPPHYWPLSLRYKDDYARADVPMLPVVRSPKVVADQIVLYSWAMVLTALALIPVADMGWLYILASFPLGGAFMAEAYALRRRVRNDASDFAPMRLFHGSISYLSLLFLAVGVDPFLR